jgi:GT2 family glycosyltransferase
MTPLPTFSIVVPTYRRPDRLSSCLESLGALDYPRDRFEVIVVDDSNRSTSRFGQMPEGLNTINVTLLKQPHAGPAAARNTGAAQARGDYLAFTDDDCMPVTGWLRAIAMQILRTPDHAIAGRTINMLPGNLFSSATHLVTDFLQEWHAGHHPDPFFASCNLAVRAKAFRGLGGFNPGFTLAGGEDREFCHRWAMSGGRTTLVPEAVVRHVHPLTLRSFWRQHFRYGRGAFLFHRLRARSAGSVRTPLSFYVALVTYPLRRANNPQRLRLTALLVLAQAATAAGFSQERLLRSRRAPPT